VSVRRQAKGGKKASKASPAEWDWEFQRERIVRPLAAALDANLLVLWRGRPVEESFLTLYTRHGFHHPGACVSYSRRAPGASPARLAASHALRPACVNHLQPDGRAA
jgi:hypothetical protein